MPAKNGKCSCRVSEWCQWPLCGRMCEEVGKLIDDTDVTNLPSNSEVTNTVLLDRYNSFRDKAKEMLSR